MKEQYMAKLSKVGLKLKKHSPEIFIVAGVAGAITSAVMACKATLKAGDILRDGKETIEEVKKQKDAKPPMPDDQINKALTYAYLSTGLKLVKLYGPSIGLGVISLTSIVSSNRILKKRNVALAAAYATIDKGFKEYRGRVKERFGEEVENEIRHNLKPVKVEETVVDPETGKEKKAKKTVNAATKDTDDYVYVIDESSDIWDTNADYTNLFIRAQQNYANNVLHASGYIFLNDVLKSLGLEPVKEGQLVGWYHDPMDTERDNYVDFRAINTVTIDELTGEARPQIRLDFNVDGYILDFI